MRIIDKENGTIVYRRSKCSLYVSAFILGVLSPLACVRIGLALCGDNSVPRIIVWIPFLSAPVVLCISALTILNASRYGVTLFHDRVEWLSGFRVQSIPFSRIKRIDSQFDEIIIVCHERRDSAEIPTSLFGTFRDERDFMIELQSRLSNNERLD